MANNDTATLIDSLIEELGGVSKRMRESQKQIDDFVNELTKAKKDGDTKAIEKLVQKRKQMFDTLSKIMERYDQSAKGVIQKLRG